MAQMGGGIMFGIGAALWNEITLKRGRIEQSNLHDYRSLRFNEAPVIEQPDIRLPGLPLQQTFAMSALCRVVRNVLECASRQSSA
jgi:hypothetical protein